MPVSEKRLQEMVSAAGIPAHFNDKGWSVRMFPCPASHHEHDNKSPATALHRRGFAKCQKCGETFDQNFMQRHLGFTPEDDGHGTSTHRQMRGVKKRDLPAVPEAPKAIPGLDDGALQHMSNRLARYHDTLVWLDERGVTADAAHIYRLGIAKTPHPLLVHPKRRVGRFLFIPTFYQGASGQWEAVTYKLRSLPCDDGDKLWFQGPIAAVFNLGWVRASTKVCMLVEAELDAIAACAMLGGHYVIAFPSGGVRWAEYWLRSFRRVHLLRDNDDAGLKMARSLESRLRPGVFSSTVCPDNHKDLGDFAVADRQSAYDWTIDEWEKLK